MRLRSRNRDAWASRGGSIRFAVGCAPCITAFIPRISMSKGVVVSCSFTASAQRRHHLDERGGATGDEAGVTLYRYCQVGHAAYPAPFIGNAWVAIQLRHSYGLGTTGPPTCGNDHALHPGAEQGRAWGAQPTGRLIGVFNVRWGWPAKRRASSLRRRLDGGSILTHPDNRHGRRSNCSSTVAFLPVCWIIRTGTSSGGVNQARMPLSALLRWTS